MRTGSTRLPGARAEIASASQAEASVTRATTRPARGAGP